MSEPSGLLLLPIGGCLHCNLKRVADVWIGAGADTHTIIKDSLDLLVELIVLSAKDGHLEEALKLATSDIVTRGLAMEALMKMDERATYHTPGHA